MRTMRTFVARVALVSMLVPALANAEVRECHVVEVNFTPAMNTSTASSRHEPSQIVVWLETPDGQYLDTLYITAQTGRHGLGNRPGRFDFNSGPMWPYGRRITTFPVWSHRHHAGPNPDGSFPEVIYQNVEGVDQCCMQSCLQNPNNTPQICQSQCANPQECESLTGAAFTNCGDNNLSHPYCHSTREPNYCQPYKTSDSKWQQADAMTCATMAFTDKGKFSSTRTSLYPPRADLTKGMYDSPSVDQYKTMAAFDAVSHATQAPGTAEALSWPIPMGMAAGSYVMWVEVAQAFDHNDTYNPMTFPSPAAMGTKAIQWADYGLPYRGQPSIIYKVPFSIGASETTSSTMDYVGYGDPDGVDGDIRPPDATISTTTPGSGAARLQLVSDGGSMYRLRVISRPELDYAAPGAPDAAEALQVAATTAKLRFVAPGDDGQVGKVAGYEVRYMANREITEDNFAQAIPATTEITPNDPGQLQTVELAGLLPETDYAVGIRALDDCYNAGALTVVHFTTADRPVGTVDACFVATAAYGSLMANDVELLRHFRDASLGRSVLGELAIETYYTFGPAVAGVVGESELLRATARDMLRPIIVTVRGLKF